MTEWREASLDDLCARITSGGTPSRKRSDYFCPPPDGHAWVKSQELLDRRVTATGEHITDGGLRGSSAKELPVGTVLIAMYGANVGQLGYLGIKATVNQAICALIADPAIADPCFLYYALAHARDDLVTKAHGAAQQNLSLQLIRPYRLRVPKLDAQRHIGAVLRATDDLIENNRRRIAVLEQMAQAIYREWFVHFRYPGHQDVPLVDSPLGRIPEGWQVDTIGATAKSLTRGIAPNYSDDGAWTILNQKCIRDQRVSLEPARRQDRSVPTAKQIRFGDVLINSTGVGTLGRLAVWLKEHPSLTVDSHVTIVRPPDRTAIPWFGLNMLSRQAELEALGTGSTGQTELSRGSVGAIPLFIPPCELREQFADLVWPLLFSVPKLLEWNCSLAGLRDLLLPKLVTGEIDVSTLDLNALVDSVA